jgi:hypothetical protein
MTRKKWAITVRRKQVSEHTLDLVVEAPTPAAARKAALDAARKANAGDLGWQLGDYDWADEPPTVDKHGKAGENDEADLVADAEGNVKAYAKPAATAFRPPGIRIARGDD